MHLQRLPIKELILIKPKRFDDERGFFMERYRHERYVEAGIDASFVQDNEVFSKKNVLRGLHYQQTPGQAKLISVLRGKIWDVAVDIRPSSPTFGCWEGVELSEENGLQFYIPVGFAHGYCVLSDDAFVTYKMSAPYDPKEERTISWNDPTLAVRWPIQEPLLSERDRMGVSFEESILCTNNKVKL